MTRKLYFENLENRNLLTTLFVESGMDTGPGLLREAISQANVDPAVERIQIEPDVNQVLLESRLSYTGIQKLTIAGNGTTIRPLNESLTGQFELFVSNGGANLEIHQTNFHKGKTGISIPVPADADGTLDILLQGVGLRNNDLFGMHVDDQAADLISATMHGETSDGDFSNDFASPTIPAASENGVLQPGSNFFSGSSTAGPTEDLTNPNAPEYPELDVDVFTIIIEAGRQLDQIILTDYDWSNPFGHTGGTGGVPGGGAFFAVQKGDQITGGITGPPAELLGAGLVGILPGATVGEDILDDLGSGTFSGAGVPSFSGPLGPGKYTFWYQEGPTDTNYTFEFVVSDTSGSDSDASIRLELTDCHVVGNGFGALDADGIRVDEGGLGNLHVTTLNSRIIGNGSDGIELDERGEGNLRALTDNSRFVGNGNFSSDDLDDGYDLDEAGSGDLWFRATSTVFLNNFDEGIDLDEEGNGDLTLSLRGIRAIGNTDEGIKASEEGTGDLFGHLYRIVSNENGEGLELEEADEGSLDLVARSIVAHRNNDGNGMKLEEDDNGGLSALVANSVFFDNAEMGLEIDEDEAGSVDLTARQIFVRRNGESGLQIKEDDEGDLSTVLTQIQPRENLEKGLSVQENGGGSLDAILRLRSIRNDQGMVLEQESNEGDQGLAYLLASVIRNNLNGDLLTTEVEVRELK
ncbi:MAG: hypothetical protein VX768_05335 [Planctomycetota bacterium]|nr:hypothetical protein [Planctomycetota bacterium]